MCSFFGLNCSNWIVMHGVENVGKCERKRLGNSVPWSRIFSRESDSHLANQTSPSFYWTQNFVTVFVRALSWFISIGALLQHLIWFNTLTACYLSRGFFFNIVIVILVFKLSFLIIFLQLLVVTWDWKTLQILCCVWCSLVQYSAPLIWKPHRIPRRWFVKMCRVVATGARP